MKKFFVRTLITISILLLLVWFGGKFYFSFSTAKYDGTINLTGINSPIEITFDAKAIPQIWAENDNDLYFALGWLHSSERLFQMELVRRYASGNLSELFGSIAYKLDLRQRQIGFARKAKKDASALSDKSREILKSYCKGINSWIKNTYVLPPEFMVLGLKPEQWTPEDCLTILYYQTWFAHELMSRDKDYNLVSKSTDKKLDKLFNKYLQWSPSTVPSNFNNEFFSWINSTKMTEASNSWVASPSKSVSGKALHASDPHLAINSFPGFWYIAGLHSEEGTNVLGITAAGIPFVTMGHTDSIAYAFTVGSVDLIDYYIEKRDKENPNSVLTPDGYMPLTQIEDSIKVKDEPFARKVILQYSQNGPVVESDSVSVTTLKWAGYDFNVGEIFNNITKMHRITNFQDFRKTVTKFGALDVNWTYSDINGNIGYQLGAPIPIRKNKNTFVHFAGEDAENQWFGYRKLEETPYAYNPIKGWLATCNNQIVSENWKHEIPGFYDPYRIIRANQLLSSKEKFTREDFQLYQLDRISGKGLQWKNLFLMGAKKLNNQELVQKISNWNCSIEEDSKIAALFELWYYYLPKYLFEDDLGKDWKSGARIMSKFLSDPDSTIVDNSKTKKSVESMTDISALSLENAILIAKDRTYGEISKLEISHPLSVVKILDIYFNLNRGPLPNAGDGGTLNSNFNSYSEADKIFKTTAGPSMRYILDWSNIDAFTMNINTGQSGNPLNNHYDDFVDFMREGKRWTIPFSKDSVYARKESLLKLLPKN